MKKKNTSFLSAFNPLRTVKNAGEAIYYSPEMIKRANKYIEQGYQGAKKKLPGNTESAAILIATTALTLGAGIGLGVGAVNYINESKDFQENINNKTKISYQKQIDGKEKISPRKVLLENNSFKDEQDQFIKKSRRMLGIAGAISGSLLATTASALLSATYLAALSNPLTLIIGSAATVLGAVVVGLSAMFVGGKVANSRADKFIAQAVHDPENQKGLDPSIKAKRDKAIAEEVERILKLHKANSPKKQYTKNIQRKPQQSHVAAATKKNSSQNAKARA